MIAISKFTCSPSCSLSIAADPILIFAQESSCKALSPQRNYLGNFIVHNTSVFFATLDANSHWSLRRSSSSIFQSRTQSLVVSPGWCLSFSYVGSRNHSIQQIVGISSQPPISHQYARLQGFSPQDTCET